MESEAVNSALKKQLEAMEEVMKSINEKQEQLQTAMYGLKSTVETMNHMSQAGCETPKDVCQDLLKAAESGDVNTAKILFKYSNDSCTTDDKYRNTPLILAAIEGHVEVVRVLLEGGAKVDRANAYGSTALHLAGGYGRLDVCDLLLNKGANVDHLNNSNETPLYYAARWRRWSAVQLLVKRGADVSVKNLYGQTASEAARSRGHKVLADWLDSVTSG